MQIMLEIPDELLANLAAPGQDPSRAALEALGLEAYRHRRISGYISTAHIPGHRLSL
jgi:hypothetical protein